MARSPDFDVWLDGVGLILNNDGIDVARKQANPFAMKSSTGERTYADLDAWAVFQWDTLHRGCGVERYGDPAEYWYCHNIDARYQNKVFLGPALQATTLTAGITGNTFFATFGTKLMMAIGTKVYELTNSTWTLRETLTAACTGMAEYNGYFYAAQGTGQTMRKTADASAWSDVGGTPAAHRLYVHGGYLYRSVNQALYYSSNPENATPTWSALIAVDDSQYVVESMVSFQNALIVFKNNGAWKIPGNPGEVDVAYPIGELNWKQAIDTDNGLQCCVWSDGFLYVTAGKGGVLRWTGRTVTPVGPDTIQAGPVSGKIWALIPTPNFMYALVGKDSVQASYIVAWNGFGWHPICYAPKEARALCYFDDNVLRGGQLYMALYDDTDNEVNYFYLPSETGDPIAGEDASYRFRTAAITVNWLLTPKFTANMHDAQKEFKEIVLWAENFGLSGTGTQQVRVDYRIDSEDDDDWITLATHTLEANDQAQKAYKTEFPISSFAAKTVSSVSNRTVTLLTGSTSDMAADDWVYFPTTNEYRAVESVTDATHFEMQCDLDDDSLITSGVALKPGLPWGRYIQFRISLYSSVTTRTPVVKALALKYLVNISDYDVWDINVDVACPRRLRNGTHDHTSIISQLVTLNEIRKKGRVAFINETGAAKTVKVSNFSLRPARQETAADQKQPTTTYWARLTLLEV